jgi:hypothetical protein
MRKESLFACVRWCEIQKLCALRLQRTLWAAQAAQSDICFAYILDERGAQPNHIMVAFIQDYWGRIASTSAPTQGDLTMTCSMAPKIECP